MHAGKLVFAQLMDHLPAIVFLVAIVRKRLHLSRSLYEFLQILSLNQFENASLDVLLSRSGELPEEPQSANQLLLFE